MFHKLRQRSDKDKGGKRRIFWLGKCESSGQRGHLRLTYQLSGPEDGHFCAALYL